MAANEKKLPFVNPCDTGLQKEKRVQRSSWRASDLSD
jgi:hypothetical protein